MHSLTALHHHQLAFFFVFFEYGAIDKGIVDLQQPGRNSSLSVAVLVLALTLSVFGLASSCICWLCSTSAAAGSKY
jgi:hypothetical protein